MSRNHQITRRAALQWAGIAGLAAVIHPQLTVAQDAELPELTFTATEYAFELAGEASAGWTRVTMINAGQMDHHLMVLKPHDGVALDDLVTALQSPDFGGIFPLASSLGGSAAGPGLSGTVAMNLAAGEYVAICAIPDDEGVPHYVHGMQLPFTIAEGDAAGDAPAADVQIELKEMTFVNLPTEVAAGAHVWEVTNTGEQLHEMLVFALAEGMSIEQGMQMFGVGMASPEAMSDAMGEATPVMEMGPPPFAMIAGVAPMSPGNTNYLMLDLQAGNYITLCFVPDMATGMPHFMMGMIAGFTVA
jgi:hypothetical protein